MAEINDLNVTDASNTARMPENQAPSSVNNGVRALEGMLARGFKDAVEGTINSTGSANAYVVAANRTISAYYDGMSVCFHASFACTGASTLAYGGGAAKALVKHYDKALASNDVKANQYVEATYSASDDNFQITSMIANPPASGLTPSDVIQVVSTIDSAVSAPTAVQIPFDDTIPQNTEGNEYMTRAITPKSASSVLEIEVVFNWATNNTSAVNVNTVALFRDAVAGALAAVAHSLNQTNTMFQTVLKYTMTSGGTSAITFKVRAGPSTGSTTITFNGKAGARIFGGVMASSIVIKEILP